MKKIIDKIEAEFDKVEPFKTEFSKAYSLGLKFALKTILDSAMNDVDDLNNFIKTFKVPFKIEGDFVEIGNKKYDSRLFQIESFRNEFVRGEIHGYKYLFKTNYPENIEGAIKSFVNDRKKTDGLSFTNFCKLKFDMNVDVVWRYNSYNKINKK